MSKKPKGFKAFDELLRKLAKLSAADVRKVTDGINALEYERKLKVRKRKKK